jgi:signal transduction histidine kinase
MESLSSIATCSFEGPKFLLFNDIPSLVYVSHIPIFIIAFFLGFFVLRSGMKSLQNRAFFLAMVMFGSWVFLDSVFWAANRSDVIMFVWSMLVFVEPIVHMCMLYLAYILSTKKDMPFRYKLTAVLIFLPQFFLVPTTYTLSGFDLSTCLPNEVFFSYYSYFIEVIFILWITLFGIISHRKAMGNENRREMTYITSGIVLFLVSFTGGNIYGTITENWTIGAIGLFGMIILSIFFAYSIVRFQTFDIKVISTQVLVGMLVILNSSQIFFAKTSTSLVITLVTLLLVIVFGTILVFAVKKEVKRKEELQKLSERLAVANQELKRLDTAKSEFISIASHQLRTPLTAIKGYASLLLEGSYGTVSAPIQDTLEKIYTINGRLVQLVEDLLSISRIEAGRIQYNFTPTHLEPLVAELVDMFSLTAKEKNLELKMRLPRQVLPQLTIDSSKIKEVISNLIDNALKYTTKGSVTVAVESGENVARIIVSDTGIGIRSEDKGKLFGKFVRTEETMKLFVSGTGLGLYVGKNFVEAHGGKIWAESDGHNQGSRFIIELPLVNPFVKKASVVPFAGSRKE